MNPVVKNFFFLAVGMIFILGSLFLFFTASERTVIGPEETEPEFVSIAIGHAVIEAEVADTPMKKNMGLSGRPGLVEGTGMLFVFDRPGPYGFWMKDMRFSIDIIWIGEDKRVISVERDVSPDTFPEVFRSDAPAKYVLEVPAGFSENFGITMGSEAYFEYKNL